MSYPDLNGKVALITGAGAGIGKTTALTLASNGAKIVCADMNESAAAEVASLINDSHPGNAISIKTDVSVSADVQAMVQKAVEAFGRLDIAVNNAGIEGDPKPMAELDEEKWDKVISVNLTGVALCLKYQLKQMIAQGGGGGSIINLASCVSFRAKKNLAAYVASKHAIVGLTKTAALEYGCHGIRVNAVAPGPTSTELMNRKLAEIGVTEEKAASVLSLLGRFAQPEEITNGIVYLASDVSRYSTGTVLGIDAGMSIM